MSQREVHGDNESTTPLPAVNEREGLQHRQASRNAPAFISAEMPSAIALAAHAKISGDRPLPAASADPEDGAGVVAGGQNRALDPGALRAAAPRCSRRRPLGDASARRRHGRSPMHLSYAE